MGRRPRRPPPASPPRPPPPSQSPPPLALPAPPASTSLPPLKIQPPNPSDNTAIVADPNVTPPNPNGSLNSVQKMSRKLSNFTAFVLNVAACDPSKPFTPARKNLIKKRLAQVFLDTHTRTPDHPTYAAMIHGAIEALNEKRGSTEESISKFIKNEYNDLPWAHDTFLKHHLGRLCESGEIVVTGKNRYALATTPEQVPPTPAQFTQNTGARRKKRRLQKKFASGEGNQPNGKEILTLGFPNQVTEEKHGLEDDIVGGQSEPVEELSHANKGNLVVVDMGGQVTDGMKVVEEKNQVFEQQDEMLEELQLKMTGLEMQVAEEQIKLVEENYQPVRQHKEVLEELDQPNQEDLGMNDLEIQAKEERINVVEQNNQPFKQQMEVLEEPNQPTEENLRTANLGIQVTEERIEVLEDKNEPVEQLKKVLEETDKPNKQIVETAGLGTRVTEESFKVVEEKSQPAEKHKEVLEFEEPNRGKLEMTDVAVQVTKEPLIVVEEKSQIVEQQEEVLEKPDQPSKENLEISDLGNQVTELPCKVAEEKNKPVEVSKEVLEEPDQPNNGNLKMADREMQATEERIGIVERNLPADQLKEVLEEPDQSKQVSSIGEPHQIEDESDMAKNHTKLQNEAAVTQPQDQQIGMQEEKQPAKLEKPVKRRIMTRSQQTRPENPTVRAETDSMSLGYRFEGQKESDLEGNYKVVLAIPATVGQSSLVAIQHENEWKKSVDRCEVETPETKPKESAHEHHSQPLTLQVQTRSRGRAQAPSCDSPSGNQRQSKRQGRGRPPEYNSSAARKLKSPQKQQLFKRRGRGRPKKA